MSKIPTLPLWYRSFSVLIGVTGGCALVYFIGIDVKFFEKREFTPEEIEQRKREGITGFRIRMRDTEEVLPLKPEAKERIIHKKEQRDLEIEAWKNKSKRIHEEMAVLYKKRQKMLRDRAVEKIRQFYKKD